MQGKRTPPYREHDGKLCFLDTGSGCGYYYNENFPDEFVLTKQSDEYISFTLIGHYSPFRPHEGERIEDRDARRAAEYDYTLDFPIELVLTEDGWRFDSFYSSLLDEDVAPQ